MATAAKSKATKQRSIERSSAKPKGSADLIRQHRAILKGARFEEIETLRRRLDLSTADMADLVLISQRTLSRRRKEGRLEPDESDRVLRVRRLLEQASELFDRDELKARRWFRTEFEDLGGESPLSLARTDAGAREVERFIGRLEHGVFM